MRARRSTRVGVGLHSAWCPLCRVIKKGEEKMIKQCEELPFVKFERDVPIAALSRCGTRLLFSAGPQAKPDHNAKSQHDSHFVMMHTLSMCTPTEHVFNDDEFIS